MKTKRMVSLFCALVLLISAVPMPVGAAEGITDLGPTFGTPIGTESADPNFQGVLMVENVQDGIKVGPTLTHHKDSGVNILREDATGLYFKDLNGNGELDFYEDWRNSSDDRAADLAERMPVEKRLMLMIHYVGNSEETLKDGGRFKWGTALRGDAETLAKGNNQLQYWAELDLEGFGIPVITASDPRHTGTVDTGNDAWDNDGEGVSKWPTTMGLAATFDEDFFWDYGEIVAKEFRLMGIQMMIAPQIDLITDPRWSRASGSITEDMYLNEALGSALIESLQTTDEQIDAWGVDDGWGMDSVATQAKHWPSGGNGENGYDAHIDMGKFGVYPGDLFMEVAESFAETAGFAEEYAGTPRQSAAVMPYFTVPFDQDPDGLNVANGFSHYIIQELLRDKYNYDGWAISDWHIANSQYWGYEDGKGYDRDYRIFMSMLAGMDQQGGVFSSGATAKEWMVGGYNYGLEVVGEEVMEDITYQSARRALKIMFNVGLFEDAYTDPEYAKANVGTWDLNMTAYETGHLDSVIMLKNADDILPVASSENDRKTVYIASSSSTKYTPVLDLTVVQRTYDVPQVLLDAQSAGRALSGSEIRDAMAEADFAILKLSSPSLGHGTAGQAQTLVFSPYTAVWSREESIGYDWYYDEACTQLVQTDDIPSSLEEGLEKGYYRSNRSTNGYTHAGTPASVAAIEEMAANKNGTPVVFILNMSNPMVPAEFETISDAILAGVGVSDNAYLEIISGAKSPNGMLPVTMPINMATVELSNEDAPHDMVPYYDSEGNHYAFGFGLTYGDGGTEQIQDERYEKFVTNNKYVNNGIYGSDLVTFPKSEIRPLVLLSEKAAELNSTEYTAESWEALEEALAEAQTLIDLGDEALQPDVDAAEAAMWTALEGLEDEGVEDFGVSTTFLNVPLDGERQFTVTLGSADLAVIEIDDDTVATVTPDELTADSESMDVTVSGLSDGDAVVTVSYYAQDAVQPQGAPATTYTVERVAPAGDETEDGTSAISNDEDADSSDAEDEDVEDRPDENEIDELDDDLLYNMTGAQTEEIGLGEDEDDDLDNDTDTQEETTIQATSLISTMATDLTGYTKLGERTVDIVVMDESEMIEITVTFKDDDEEIDITIYQGESVGNAWPDNPVKEGYRFLGWFDEDGTEYTRSTLIADSITLYASWQEIVDPVDQVTVTFNDRGTLTSATTQRGTSVGNAAWPNPTRSGYSFGGWYTEENGQGTRYTATSIISGDLTLYAYWTSTGTSTGGSRSGGGNGGSSGWSSPSTPFGISGGTVSSSSTSANVNSDGSVNQTTILSEANTALAAAPEGGTATVKTQNGKSISAAALGALNDAAVAAGKSVVLHADTMSGSAVQGRLYVQPGSISSDLQLGVYTEASQVAALKNLFESWFTNKLAVVKFDQQGNFGTRLQVAAKVDLSGMDTGDLKFYAYDQASNTYRLIEDPAYTIDANGYLHFYTQQAGSVIISEGALAKK